MRICVLMCTVCVRIDHETDVAHKLSRCIAAAAAPELCVYNIYCFRCTCFGYIIINSFALSLINIFAPIASPSVHVRACICVGVRRGKPEPTIKCGHVLKLVGLRLGTRTGNYTYIIVSII